MNSFLSAILHQVHTRRSEENKEIIVKNIDWLIGTVNADKQLKYITFWHEGKEYPNHYASVVPIAPFVRKNTGRPQAAPMPKQTT